MLDRFQQSLVLEVDAGVLVSNSIDHSTLAVDLLHFHRVSLAKGLRNVQLIRDISRVVLIQPAHSGCLDPCTWFWLHFLGGLLLHGAEATQVV